MQESSSSSSQDGRRFCVLLFASTIFVSAFLLFQVQPLISKFILPWFGGSPAVWSTCMLFFQVTLFGGYVYAHLTSQYLSPKWQAVLHLSLLCAACFLLPITPDDSWKPTGHAEPTLRIVALLTMCVGLPYFILSSTGPLLQSWFSLQAPGTSPYRLYSLSNIGSLLALISYPFVVEPAVNSPTQAGIWSVVFGLFALLCTVCAVRQMRVKPVVADLYQKIAATNENQIAPSWADRIMWFGLAMVASVMLLATTNQVCLDVATVPFLWILPLTLYLMSFILCFDADRWYSRKWYMVLLVISLMFVVRTLLNGSGVSILLQVVTYLSALYFCCMVCHGELAQQKPHAKYLTQFYLLMSAGGAGGGLFVGLIAPYVFPAYWELHFGIVACLLAALAVYLRDQPKFKFAANAPVRAEMSFRPMTLVWPLVGFWVLWSLQSHARETVSTALEVSRNFYGVIRVEDQLDENGKAWRRGMFHGNILHGTQFTDSARRRFPTTYYGRQSGVGLAMQFHKLGEPRRIGVVGLGVGTLATYGLPGDKMRFYEINPEVIRLAQSHFSFLSDSDATCTMVTGDARLSLEHEPKQKFDILVLDAFSGDAIPTHLLTHEAAQLYKRNLNEDGILAIHISNLHFDLRPIVMGLAEKCGWQATGVQDKENDELGTSVSHWMLLSRRPIDGSIVAAADEIFETGNKSILWTDEWSNLLSVLR